MRRLILYGLVLSVIFIAGCGKTKDSDNKNINKEYEKTQIKNVEVYYDMSHEMVSFLDDNFYREIAYTASSSAKDTFYEAVYNVFAVSDEIIEIEPEKLNGIIVNPDNYSSNNNIFKDVLKNIKEDSVTIIVSQLSTQLVDYSEISKSIVDNVLKNNKAVGFIGVDFYTKPLFIIAISDNENLSEYIKKFKSNPSVSKFAKSSETYQTDTVEKINYQIIANHSGINGFDYENIEYKENEYFYIDDDINQMTLETKGSFTKLNENYNPAELDDIEGTVNFTNNVPQLVLMNNKDKSNTRYIGLSSLLYDSKANDIGGKIKLKIPVNIIEGVKLSKLNCDISYDVYFAKKNGSFKPYKYEGIKISLADGLKALPEQGKWRIDDKDNSMLFNIIFDDITEFPKNEGAFKIDVKFTQYDSIDSVSEWVKDWDKYKVYNLMNLFNSIYSYQAEANKSENELTVYVGTGNKSLYKRAKLAAEPN